MSSSDSALAAGTVYRGPAFLARGLRPFFLLAGLYAVVSLLLWLGMLAGHCSLPSAFEPLSWHVHEMLFGFVQAAVAGFALTAVPHWTGRPVLKGLPLLLLILLWLAGRVAVATSSLIGPPLAAAADLAFPLTLVALIARDILRAKLWHGFLLVALLSALAAANALTHLELAGLPGEFAGLGQRFGLSALVMLVSLIGGRVIPNFTGNWLAARGGARPPLAGPADHIVLMITALALVSWSVLPQESVTGALAALAAAGQSLRLARWRGLETLSEPLVWSLHLGYAWLPVGFLLLSAAILRPDLLPLSAGVHAFAAGGLAGMILAMTTRATLGHTGRPLRADRLTLTLYLLVFLGACLRVGAALLLNFYLPLLLLAGVLWLLAFAGFLWRYAPMLLTPRADGRPA